MGDHEKWLKSVPTKQPETSLDDRMERLFENAEWDAHKPRRFAWPIGWALSACTVCIVLGFWLGRTSEEEQIRPLVDWDTDATTYYVIEVESGGDTNVFDVPRTKQPFLSGNTEIVIIDGNQKETVSPKGNQS